MRIRNDSLVTSPSGRFVKNRDMQFEEERENEGYLKYARVGADGL